jgi:cytochrome c biogenesis protein CcmG/thiol:disulfide interchange protein DsbE
MRAPDVVTALVVAVVGACAAGHGTAPTGGERNPARAIARKLVGTRAPSFALPVIGNASIARLSDFAGQVVVLDFWATWCTPCVDAVPGLNDLHDRYAARGLRIIGVSNDEPDEDARFAVDHAIKYTLAQDPEDKVASAYQVAGIPMVVVIDRAGIVRYVDVRASGSADERALEAAIVDALH